MLKMAFGLLTLLVPLQMVLGDLHGLNTREHQPAKLAAMEANWETQSRMPLLLFAWPDERAEANRFEVAIPALGSLILTHDRGRRRQGTEGLAAGGSPAGGDTVLFVPADGRHRPRHAGADRVQLVGLGARRARSFALVPQAVRNSVAAGIRRGDRRLGDDRSRAGSRGRSTDCCERRIRSRRRLPAATSWRR